MEHEKGAKGEDSLWYKDAVIYELHVRSFKDSTGDGIGDFRGLIQKLDYLEDLGVTAVWLLPFYRSPMKDDGYDISDFFGVNQDYGNLRDFKDFLREAHKRGIKVITELVLNHTSDQHPWFQRSRQSGPGSRWREYYTWSDDPGKYKEARIIFKDFESSNWKWDPLVKSYYWHRFYSHQPELNYDNPEVQREMFRVIDFWLGMGVDCLRLDAVPYLYEREGTNCENLPETHALLKKLRAHVDSRFSGKALLAEANQWPEDAAEYLGKGDESHMAFHFPLMPRMFMAIQMEDRFPIINIFEQTPQIPESCQWVTFLRNHDELTLEMVTDEERDYMYRVYARDPRMKINLGIRRRLSPLMGNDRRKIELLNVLLFSLPGTPVVYYGDEIGMGDNYYLGDRNGVRTPMQWSSDKNAGFSEANPQKLYLPVIIDPEYHYEALNVENENANPNSLLRWMKRLIAMRKTSKAFGRGTLEFLFPENPKVLAFIRKHEEESILVVANLSRLSQVVELDVSKYSGFVPEDIFSKNKFPAVKETPYVITMTPYDFYIFSLKKEEAMSAEKALAREITAEGLRSLLEGRQIEKLEAVLPDYLKNRRWFWGKSKLIQGVEVVEDIKLAGDANLLIVKVSYTEGTSEFYLMPLSFASGEMAAKISEKHPQAVVTRLRTPKGTGIVYDSAYDEGFRNQILHPIARKVRLKGKKGQLIPVAGKNFRRIYVERIRLPSEVIQAEFKNTSFLYKDVLYFKLFRRLDVGTNPDLEISRFLTEKAGFKGSPPYVGAIEYRQPKLEPITIGILQGFVPNQGDAWNFTLGSVGRYFERVLSKAGEKIPEFPPSLINTNLSAVPPLMQDLVGADFLEMINILGKRTAEMHLALSSSPGDPVFTPEPFSILYQRSLYQSMQSLLRRTMQLLKNNLKKIPESVRKEASEALELESIMMYHMKGILDKKLTGMKIRIHGDFHLGQVLYTGDDWVIFDFEGEPARALSERKLKYSPLRDVAGMIRSFHYAAYSALLKHAAVRPEDIPVLEPWLEAWYHFVSGVFLSSYLATVKDVPILPEDRTGLELMLHLLLLEKAVYEMGYELNNRPEWVVIPIKGIKHILRRYLGEKVK